MMPVEEARDELKHLLSRCGRWLCDEEGVRDLLPDIAGLAGDAERLEDLRTRALSSMLNVALLGRQSSGKSFLISGLQGGLEYVPITDEDGMPSAEFLGVLPSSARPTTACPCTVIPVGDDPSDNDSGRALLRVRFAGGGVEDIGSDLPPAVVAAYGAADGDVTNRRREHINRRVESIEVLIADARLPVKLFDLPGSESPIAEHELIMREAWAKADCFIYVSHATSALTSNELQLIRDLYAHHMQSNANKRVLWVLTGIDLATQREQGQAAWKSVLTTNNDYLRTHFGAPGGHFIGEGFLPVSAAWEAEADFRNAQGDDGSALGRLSGMETLRDHLQSLMESGAGHAHLRQVADEARWLVRRRQRQLADMLDTHQLAVEDLEVQQDSLRGRIAGAERSLDRIRTELGRELQRRIRAARGPFNGLADELHQQLDPLIDSGNLSAEHANEVDVLQVQLFSQWMTSPAGPATLWERELQAFDASARQLLRADLGVDTGSQLVSPEPLDTSYFPMQTDGRQPLTAYGVVQAAANTLGVASPIAAGAVWLTTSLSLATIAVPAGAAVLTAIAVAKVTDVLKDRESKVQRARQERKDMIDEQVKQARSAFESVTQGQGRLLIDAVDHHHLQHQTRLKSTLAQIMERINAEGTIRSRAVIDRLTPVNQTGQALVTALQDLRDALRNDGRMGR
ncbi:dynamin family protein [Streptomyces sp. NPDC048636]|uniref:dynamin family protein n=1 Tax=Streptomyces sp. NPDC048636 TaxID=3155762 RepID=UPI00341DBE77